MLSHLSTFLLIISQAFTTFATLTYIPSPFNSIKTFLFDLGADSLNNANMAQAWTFGNLAPTNFTRTSNCGSYKLMGGLGILTQSTFVERTYTDLPSHTSVAFLITIFTIDNWQNSDFLTIQIDGSTVLTYYPHLYTGMYIGNLCGDSLKADTYTDFTGQWPHTAETITIRVTASLSSQGAGFGIYQVLLHFPTISSPITTLICPGDYCQYLQQQTDCYIRTYLPIGASTCASCPTGCSYCWGPALNQCFVCYSRHSFDGTQCIPCPSHCQICTSTTQCDTCSTGYVLDTDNTCKSACSNPNAIIKGTGSKKFCVNPCPSGQRMRWDYTCTSTCNSPLIPVGDFCDFPCGDNEYLYPNGTCAAYCNSPYLTEIDQQENFIPKYCNLPCGSSGYLYEDDSCHSNCPQSMVTSTYETLIKLCSMATLTPEETKDIEKTASTAKASGKVGKAGLAAVNIASPSNPGSLTSGSLQKMLLYLRYLNISQTPRLEVLFNELSSSSTDFMPMPNLPQSFKNGFPSYPLPYMFTKYNLSSNFISNCGNDLISLLIWIGAFIILFVFDKVNRYLRNIGIYRRVIKQGKIILQNYALGQFYQLFGEIIFFAMIDLRANEYTSGKDNISLLTMILCLISCIAFLVFYCWTLHRYQKLKTSKQEAQFRKFKDKYEGVQLFYEDFIDTSFIQQGFLFFSLVRIIMFYLVIALVTANPITQVFILILLNMWILIYLISKRPLKSKIELAQQISFELVFMTVHLSFLTMALTDYSQYNWTVVRKNTSEIVIVCNVIFTFLPIAFMALKLLITAWESYHWVKEHLTSKTKIKPSKLRLDSEHNMETCQDSPSPQFNRNERKLSFSEINSGLPPLESFRFISLKNKKKRIQPANFFGDRSIQNETPMFENILRTQCTERSSLPLNTEL